MQKELPAALDSPGRIGALGRQLAAFGIVGGIGFGIDLGLTLALVALGTNPFFARAIGIAIALVATYLLNRCFTFRASASRGGRAVATESMRYGMIALGSSALNWAVFAVALLLVPAMWPALALVIGSGVAMGASYIGYRTFAFRG